MIILEVIAHRVFRLRQRHDLAEGLRRGVALRPHVDRLRRSHSVLLDHELRGDEALVYRQVHALGVLEPPLVRQRVAGESEAQSIPLEDETDRLIKVDRRKMPLVEAGVIRPQDFVKVIKFLKGVINNSRPKQHTLPYERAIRDLAIIRFAYATGCRRGEVAGLRTRDLYLADNKAIIQLKTSKTKRNRPDVFFGKQARLAIEDWLEIRPEKGEQLFLGTRGNGWSQEQFTPAGIYQAWKEWQKAAGVGPYRFHEIRHSHITHSMNSGIPIHHVSKQAGHSSSDITLRVYTHSQDEERKQAYSGKNPDDLLEE